MTTLVKELLSTFGSLPESERLEIAVEILKRVTNLDFPPLSDDDLVWNAEEIFLELDQQETDYEYP
ncbi:MAG: hypothetical protein ACKPEO_04090 [Sphaerospermopsis kisseleviana]|uniref:Uncharacterized protein n=2 Tax=Sphaerospermopsis TaxID=752201 RepID=A0ABR9V8T0_9CYAN|nr:MULTISPECIES: hypothetical protein [Sphaerospermopsis]MBD2146292.1 hypothetical protein [Sphaerospermopsis sp. FACHB-1194]MBE9234537.1 hypothetical protein [Sphaerospermopsis aphanizomenoides LEGE 00250]MDB9442506.1 hypothetical protein [Sphaerospermopsis kisseleviana CS-549]BAZ83189.1 hypothetical protein NIES73_44760 [Sphaerospermopsis kisseleviana NIES-73]